GGEGPDEVHRALQQCMNDLVGIFRKHEDLEAALGLLDQLDQRARKVRVEGSRAFNPGWHLARDLRNMITVSKAVTRSALLRKESRGAHSRLDFPSMGAALGKGNMCGSKSAEGRRVGPAPLPGMPIELKALFGPAEELVRWARQRRRAASSAAE